MSGKDWRAKANFEGMENEDYKDVLIAAFGKRIKALRLEKDYTQLDLAIRCSVDPRQISRIENGAGSTGLGTIGMLAKGLEMSLSELFDFEIEPAQE